MSIKIDLSLVHNGNCKKGRNGVMLILDFGIRISD
jgi:hypothetical protein